MKKKSRVPISWKMEEYAFGAVALREEIARHKKEDSVRWSLAKEVGIRALFVYACIVTIVLVIYASALSLIFKAIDAVHIGRK